MWRKLITKFSLHIEKEYQEAYKNESIKTELFRSRFVALILASIEVIMIATSILKYKENIFKTPQVNYFFMYLLMMVTMAVFYLVFRCIEKRKWYHRRGISILSVFYLSYILLWNVIVAFFDQATYGQISTYTVPMICIAFLTASEVWVTCLSYFIAHTVFLVFLPHFQSSAQIVYGHDVNATLSMVMSCCAAYFINLYRVMDFRNRIIIQNKNHELAMISQRLEAQTEALKISNEALAEQHSQLRLILDTTAEGIFGTDMKGDCTFCNHSCLRLLGYDLPEDILGKEMRGLIYHSLKDGTLRLKDALPLTEYLTGGNAGRPVEDVLWRADGVSFDAEYRALPQYKEGKQVGFVVTFSDITERKREEEQIRFLSYHDALTELKNRRYFEQEMTVLDTVENLPISIVFIDLNGLKIINDTFGHSAGDELIIKAAEVLKGNCRENDVSARVGGDEYAILLPKTAFQDAVAIGDRIKAEFSQKRVKMIVGSMALGVSSKTRIYQKIEQILKSAENEMYKEKNVSGKRFGMDVIESIIRSFHEKCLWEKRHSEEVCKLCGEIGIAMKLPEPEIRKLRNAGYLHDIGKIALSDDILGKATEALSEAERELMCQHPGVGYRILNLSEDLRDIADDVFGHHESWDGSGYPKGLKGEEIPRISRIVSVAEAYERIWSSGNYTEESNHLALKKIMDGAGKQFDPQIAAILQNIL